MAKKQRRPAKKPSPQLVVRLPPDMNEDLREAARGLGMDVSDLVRMMLKLNLPGYLKQARDAQAQSDQLRSGQSNATPRTDAQDTSANPPVGSARGGRSPKVPPLSPEELERNPHERQGLDLEATTSTEV